MWPGFDSQMPIPMWVEFVGSLLSTERFSPGTPISPLLKNQKFDLIVLIVNFSYSALALERPDTQIRFLSFFLYNGNDNIDNNKRDKSQML